jgi:hypothetical protein
VPATPTPSGRCTAAAGSSRTFPADIGHVLDSALSRGTFLAIVDDGGFEWGGDMDRFLASPPESWAVACSASRCAALPPPATHWTAAVPDLFRPFAGVWFAEDATPR